ncbi:MAG: hypothetical protein ACRD8U_06550 [Pyrinomonadaceae bacterium]
MLNLKRTGAFFALLILSVAISGFSTEAEPAHDSKKTFDKDGLAFDFGDTWELIDHSNAAAQQLVLTEKTLDAQIMIVALRGRLTTGKQEEEAKTSLIEPGINRVLKQYENGGVKVSRLPLKIELSGGLVEGTQLQFAVDGNAGTTEICWGVIGKRLVQLFFIRPDKTAAETGVCWSLIRSSLRMRS